jgi:rod shape-determining protein MreD
MAVYFWSLVRPDLMPPAAALLIGIVQDFVSGSPVGLWATAYVAIYAVLGGQRDSFAGLAGIGAILGFALAMLLVSAATYGIAVVYFWRVLPLMPHVLQIAVSVLCYVPLLPMLNGLQHKVVGPLRSEF